MRSPFGTAALLATLLFLRPAAAQTVVNSTYIGRAYGSYGAANNWAPAEVPNNTGAKNYNVTIPPTSAVAVDVDATISNLTLGSFLDIFAKTLAVTGTTLSPANQAPNVSVMSDASVPATFNAGTLAAFSGNTLGGRYIIASGGSPAAVQFKGANVVTLNGELSLFGAFARVVDEGGSDALRNLARIESGSVLTSDGRDLAVAAPFTNNGTLHLGGENATIFTAANSLTNFDFGTRTLTGGKFILNQFSWPGNLPVELRFGGADIVNNGSAIELGGAASRIADLAGNDGLRNLARNLPGASLTLAGHDFATAGQFGNEGLLSLAQSTFIVAGPFTSFDPATRTLTRGAYEMSGGASLKFSGADIVHNGASIFLFGGSITDLTGNNGLRNFSDNLAGAVFVVGQDEEVKAPGDFTNAGRIETTGYYLGIPENPPAVGKLTVPPGFSYTQTAGTTVNNGTLTADRVNIFGGSLDSGIGTINGNVTVTDATVFPGKRSVVNGNVTLNSGSRYHTTIDGFRQVTGWCQIAGKVVVAGTLEFEMTEQVFLGSAEGFTVLESNTSITGTFGNAPNGTRILTSDGRGSFVVVYEPKRVTLTQFMAVPPPVQLLNISTRAFLSASNDDAFHTRSVLIGGFIVTGAEPKTVALRGIGPSLSKFGLDPTLADPVLELHGSGVVIATNDNWKDAQQNAIAQSGLAPGDDREAAMIVTLDPGYSYTVILREKSGFSGYGLVEVYDLSRNSRSKLANISTRGFTDSSTLLIGGVIIGGDGQANDEVVVRAIGPDLRIGGIFNALDDPTLELRDGNGSLVASNDDWATNYDQIPGDFRPLQSTDSALRVSLSRGNYTAIVRAKPNGGGVALVEFYDLWR
jgi:hypothetical protein